MILPKISKELQTSISRKQPNSKWRLKLNIFLENEHKWMGNTEKYSSCLGTRKYKLKLLWDFDLTSVRIYKINITNDIASAGEGAGERRTFIQSCWDYKLLQPLYNQCGGSSKSWKSIPTRSTCTILEHIHQVLHILL